jgi:hypothetical protein
MAAAQPETFEQCAELLGSVIDCLDRIAAERPDERERAIVLAAHLSGVLDLLNDGKPA